MNLWVCIPVHNRLHYTKQCLLSLLRQEYPVFTIVICDDGSTDGTAEWLASDFPQVTVLKGDGELWWTGAINRCVEYVLKVGNKDKDAIVTLNNDVEVEPTYLSVLVETSSRFPDAIITSAGYDIRTRQMVSPGSRQSWLTSKIRTLDLESDLLPDSKNIAEVTHAPGRGTLIPLKVFGKIGLYDEKHLPHYGADFDFTHRARRAGYRILISYLARVFSHVEATGMTVVRRDFGFDGFIRYLTDRKSPANLNARWWLAFNNCPRILLPSFLILDFCFVVGSFLKYHLKSALTDRRHV